jgi:hypothetical protein
MVVPMFVSVVMVTLIGGRALIAESWISRSHRWDSECHRNRQEPRQSPFG